MELTELKFTISGVEECRNKINRVQKLIAELEEELDLLKEVNITVEPSKY